ncbi:hypothetical protein GCM10022224_067270 [Nonomuraea antimicrobica]|uniref:Uncharacterized protein n=1 Tax=Nonomuraea antimicrobica TaxID=561173 RepID=A0ABP7CK31_9ACTN
MDLAEDVPVAGPRLADRDHASHGGDSTRGRRGMGSRVRTSPLSEVGIGSGTGIRAVVHATREEGGASLEEVADPVS